MSTRQLSRVAISAAFLGITMAMVPSIMHAVEGCRVKVSPRDGVLLVSAKNVSANPRWGFTPSTTNVPFANETSCVGGGVAKSCVLGDPGTAARITPPDLCTLYVTDDSATVCAAYIKGCVPGVRNAVQGPPGPQGDPGPQGEPGPQGAPGHPAVVKDAGGVTVGVVVGREGTGINRTAIVIASLGGSSALIEVSSATITGDRGALLYESNDCSGQALAPAPGVYTSGVVIGDDLYYGAGTVISNPVLHTTLQEMTQNDCSAVGGAFVPPDGCCRQQGTFSEPAAPATGPVDLGGLVPPFRVEVQ